MSKQAAINFLEIALRKSSKSAIEANIQQAIEESGAGTHVDLDSLISLYEGADYSANDLKIMAECFLADLNDEVAWKLYHAPQ